MKTAHLPANPFARRREIAAAMRALADAAGAIARINGCCDDYLRALPPGHPDERTALALRRAGNHLSHAVADVPNECWAIMLADKLPPPPDAPDAQSLAPATAIPAPRISRSVFRRITATFNLN